MARLGPLVLLLGLLARCGGAVHAPAISHIVPQRSRTGPARLVVLHPGEQRTFRPGALRPGGLVVCTVGGHRLHVRIPNHPSGGWSVGSAAATPAGTSSELQVGSNADGSVTASCDRKTS